jgi:hypothetical protein
MTSGWTRRQSAAGAIDFFIPTAESPPSCALLHLRDPEGPDPAENSVLTAALERHRLRVYSPAFNGCWWLDRLCDVFPGRSSPLEWLRTTAAAEIRELWNVPGRGIGLLGTGVGGNGVLQLAYRFPKEFPVVAAIAPAVDFHKHFDRDPVLQVIFSTAEAARQETATLRIHPLNWPPHQWLACDPHDPDWFDGCERLVSKLSSIGILFETDLKSTAGGRRADYERRMLPTAIDFVVERLQGLT